MGSVIAAGYMALKSKYKIGVVGLSEVRWNMYVKVMRQAIEAKETCTNLAEPGPRCCIAGKNWQYWQGGREWGVGGAVERHMCLL